MKGQTLLRGHTLRYEGDAFDDDGKRIWQGWIGRGKCSCGAMSDTLPTNTARKRWHREHKDQIRDA